MWFCKALTSSWPAVCRPLCVCVSLAVLRDRICSMRRHVQWNSHGRSHQTPQSQQPSFTEHLPQSPCFSPRGPEGNVSDFSYLEVEMPVDLFFMKRITALTRVEHFSREWSMHQCILTVTQYYCLTHLLCSLFFRCANDNIHKDFRKAIGANCIFYSAQTHELIVLVSFYQTTQQAIGLGSINCISVYINISISFCQFWFQCEWPHIFEMKLILVSFFFSVNKRNNSKACNNSERHAFPQHPHKAYANVP